MNYRYLRLKRSNWTLQPVLSHLAYFLWQPCIPSNWNLKQPLSQLILQTILELKMKRHSAILNFWHNQKKKPPPRKQCTYSGTRNWRSACGTRKIKHWIYKEHFLLVFSMKELWQLRISNCQQLSSRKNRAKFTSTFFPRYKVLLASIRKVDNICHASLLTWS